MYGQIVTRVLEEVSEVVTSGVDRFVAKEHFTKEKFHVDRDFKDWMLPKVEREVRSSTLIYGRVLQPSNDLIIVSALGGEKNAETYLWEVFHLLTLQPKGEPGHLQTNGDVNLFYVRDRSSSLRVISVEWKRGSWYIHAYDTPSIILWSAQNQVFSHKRVDSY